MTFVWADGHAKARPYSQTLRMNDQTNDDWASNLQPNLAAGRNFNFADRQAAVASGYFPEYR